MLETDTDEATVVDEKRQVVLWRYQQARDAGLTLVEARIFSECDQDVGVLRQLVRRGCPPTVIARILL
jgi:hypothetical protein